MTTQTEVCQSCGRPLPTVHYRDDYLEIDLAARTLKVKGRDVDINGLPWEILVYLVDNRGKAVSNLAILRKCWGSEHYDYGLVKWQLSELRKMLRSASGQEPPITTVRGYGYRYDG